MPRLGYTGLFENMLDHPNIKLLLNTDYREVRSIIPFGEMIYTGPIDEFFAYRFGKLPYRSLEFKHETHDIEFYQSAPVVNYPNDYLFTRITEFKYLTGQKHEKTSIVYEFPKADGDPYYPVPQPQNAELYQRYLELAKIMPNTHFCGRLATYRYYNMDQVVAQALTVFKHIAQNAKATKPGNGAERVAPARLARRRSSSAKPPPARRNGIDGLRTNGG
jgi:UDP-galactopyranose mutase